MRFLATFTVLSLMLTPMAALACSGPDSETASLLKELPRNAKAEASTVAKVRILQREGYSPAVVVVVRAIKGTKQGDKFTVHADGHSCAADIGAKAGDVVFVAGYARLHPHFVA